MGQPATTAATAATDLVHRRIRVFVGVAILAALGVLAVYVVFVRTRLGQQFDDVAFDGRHVVDPRVTRRTEQVLSSVTTSSLLLMTLAIVALALARRRPRLALVAGAAVAGAVVITEVLKHVVLTRPSFAGIVGVRSNSFPSGHATIGMALSLGLVMVTPHRWRWLAAAVAVGVALLFGVGVMATGWHRPSDTIGAFGVCAAVFAAATAVLLHWRAAEEGAKDFGEVEEQLTPPVALASAGLVVVTAVVALWLTLQEGGLRTVEFGVVYVAVSGVILLLGVAVVLGYHELLRGLSLDPPPAG